MRYREILEAAVKKTAFSLLRCSDIKLTWLCGSRMKHFFQLAVETILDYISAYSQLA
jgi:hypothetical protein